MDDAMKIAIEDILKKIVDGRIKKVQKLKLNSFSINPFLMKILELNTPRKVAEFLMSQRMERSVVTSFGQHIENIVRVYAGGNTTGVECADISKMIDGTMYYIQVKAGPSTLNKDGTKQACKKLLDGVRRDRGSVALIGISYGKKPSSIVNTYSTVDCMIGAEFWGFVTGDENAAYTVFLMIDDIVKKSGYRGLYDDKTEELTNEIRERYGNGGENFWKLMFDDNMYSNDRVHRLKEQNLMLYE